MTESCLECGHHPHHTSGSGTATKEAVQRENDASLKQTRKADKGRGPGNPRAGERLHQAPPVMARRESDELDNDRLLRHGFVWLVAVFSSIGVCSHGGIGLATGVASSSTFQHAFPDLTLIRRRPFVPVFLPCRARRASTDFRDPCRCIRSESGYHLRCSVRRGCGRRHGSNTRRRHALVVYHTTISGVSVGIISVAVPLYQCEVAPAQLRGRLMATFQLAITLGILVAFMTDFVLAQLPTTGDECELYAPTVSVGASCLHSRSSPGLCLP